MLFNLACAAAVAAAAAAAVDPLARVGARGSRQYVGQAINAEELPNVRVGDVTDVRLWPQPASVTHAGGQVWTFIAGPNMAATGPDCPFLSRGPADNLTVCEAACADDGACNVVNYDPTLPDCVFRSCSDPMHPQVSAYPNYSVYGTVRQSFALSPSSFSMTSVGFSDPILSQALARYGKLAFVYGPGSASSSTADTTAGGAAAAAGNGKGKAGAAPVLVPGLRVNVTTSNTLLDGSTDESYTLIVPDPDPNAQGWGTITAPTVYGAMRALETFTQLVQYNLSDGTYSLVYTSITDAPRYPYRAVLVDTSRHYITTQALKLIMDQMAYLKLNVLHWHISDDQSWPLELKSAPLLAQRSAFSNYSHTYSAADVADLVAYAKNRAIRIIPEFDSPSHFSSLFNAYPQYAALSYDQNNNSYLCMVDITEPEVWTFLGNVWGEIASMFPDSHMFIGGDEFWACWGQSPKVSAWMKEHNMSITDTYYYYERRIIDIMRANGKDSIAWLDIAGFPQGFSGNYSAYPDVTLDVWTGCYSGNWQDDTATFTSQGMGVVVSGPFYITQQNGAPTTPHFTWQEMYSIDLSNFTGSGLPVGPGLYRGKGAGMPHNSRRSGSADDAMITPASDPTANVTRADLVQGGELCAWDDAAQTDSGDLWMSLTPYMIGFAEAMWSPQSYTSGRTPDEDRAHAHRCRMVARGIPSHPIYAFGSYCPFEYEPLLASWD